MKFFDANIQLGRRCLPKSGEPVTTEEILGILSRCQIEKAIAYHAIAKEGGMPDGNGEILKITGENTPFLPQWCAMPSTFGEFLSVDDLFAGMKRHHVTSLRLLPKTCNYSLRPYALQKLMDAAADCHVPVFLNAPEELSPEDTYALCRNYPQVNFVFCGLTAEDNRMILPIMEQCANFCLVTGSYEDPAVLCKQLGAERLIFASGLPFGNADTAVSQILTAPISEEEKEQIAHGNLERLLSGVTF